MDDSAVVVAGAMMTRTKFLSTFSLNISQHFHRRIELLRKRELKFFLNKINHFLLVVTCHISSSITAQHHTLANL